jgi:hypothetical protein
MADNVVDLFSAPLTVTFDPKQLSLVDIQRGALLSAAGEDIIFSRNIQNDAGQARINISRFPGSSGVSGSGALIRLDFQPLAAGSSTVAITTVNARNAKSEAIPLSGTLASVTIK